MASTTSAHRPRRSLKALSSTEKYAKMMQGTLPCMTYKSTLWKPNLLVVDKLREIIESGIITQKQIAIENHLR